MNHNVDRQNSNLIKATNTAQKQAYCTQNQFNCNSAAPSSNCTSVGKTDNCTNKDNFTTSNNTTTPVKGQKRGYKSHVPSACINCKIAHLACDVSRPCKRCITLKKTDTCQDMQHKKRGRPKLKDKRSIFPTSISAANNDNFKILYGTIETPALIFSNATDAASTSTMFVNNNNTSPSIQKNNTISFIHEAIESFQSTSTTATTTTTYHNNNNNTNNTHPLSIPHSTSTLTSTKPTSTFMPEIAPTTTAIASTNNILLTPISMKQTPANMSLPQQNNMNGSKTITPTPSTTTATTTFITDPMAITAPGLIPQPFYWDTSDNSQIENNIISSLIPFMSFEDTLSNVTAATANVSTNTYSNTTLPALMKEKLTEPSTNDYTITLILSMEICCAKAPDDVIEHWGYYPQELAHRSLYDFISPKDTDRLARLHRLLIDNTMNIIRSQQASPPMALPASERTTSSLFNTTDQEQLKQLANGSKQYSDTIHIRKRSGDFELYDVIVYIGGGLGADLYDLSSLSKQYIVAQLKKHEYEVKPARITKASMTSSAVQQQSSSNTVIPAQNASASSTINRKSINNNLQPGSESQPHSLAAFSPLSPLSPASSFSASSSPSNRHNSNDINSRKTYKTFMSIKPSATARSPLNLFNKIDHTNNHLASFEKKKRQLSISVHQPNLISTTSAPTPHHSPPKFHIAPITDPYSPIKKTAVLPIATLATATAPTTAVVMHPSIASPITHPTQQYFLQTSSSTLNAAASSVQNKSRTTVENPILSTTTNSANRKIEMSIRSLLC
ncbi:hypothetical protein BDF20DRAFT_892203 [Mycotypha africana]|uniref:uncharacterized protein n=1 Tax=Mycotypha africana TaxID=64632 RepID=UPI0023010BEA|nr:uncharacterized protein BDF20DRAFT_892203 [Mycotypha africana]KAI8968910.1 hypothetical protein BDF20DRAFT_892203 [Mycotypha africana]